MPSKPRFDDELADQYSVSGSDEEYTENEKKLLSKVRNRHAEQSDSENEVFAVRSGDSDSEDDDDKSDIALSDVEGQDIDDDLPDVRAWGKDKKKYYKTDYVDADYGGFQGKDAHLAELEEEEARNLQKQLAQQLDDDDFSLHLPTKKIDDEKPTEEIVKTDISKLSKRQKLQILEKESPEFFSLVEDFKAKMTTVKDYLHPVLKKHKNGQLLNCTAVDFVQTHYSIILNYCVNIYMYLYLKSVKANIQNHPVIKRLFQYRQLLLQLEPVFEEVVKPQIEMLLSEKEIGGQKDVKKKVKQLKFLTSLSGSAANEKLNKKKKIADRKTEEVPVKKVKFSDTIQEMQKMEINSESEGENKQEEKEEIEELEAADVAKRAITYEMAKNKGLTPHRKKEQRNPRVKHKLKYRKAVIRRKGAVREPRKELSRYSGEISGIKATVSRSVKIK